MLISLKDITKKAKGVIRSTLKHQINVDHYFESLKTNKRSEFIQKKFVSKKQRLYLESFKKISLSSFDLKRFWLNNGIQSVPYSLPERFFPTFHPILNVFNENSSVDFTPTFTEITTSLGEILNKIHDLKKSKKAVQPTDTTASSSERDFPTLATVASIPTIEWNNESGIEGHFSGLKDISPDISLDHGERRTSNHPDSNHPDSPSMLSILPSTSVPFKKRRYLYP